MCMPALDQLPLECFLSCKKVEQNEDGDEMGMGTETWLWLEGKDRVLRLSVLKEISQVIKPK